MKKFENKVGIMSGRLSKQIGSEIQEFPTKTWQKEFELASKCGFGLIEWIFDLNDNPIVKEDGIKKIRSLSREYNVQINSICCDYFMKRKLFKVSDFELEKNFEVLKKIIDRAFELEANILEIPFVDASSIKTESEQKEVIDRFQEILPIVEKNNLDLTFETDLPPQKFRKFLEKFDHPNIKANYDTGNSTSLGYSIMEEINEIGDWIKNIHIKDRLFHGTTVPLGTGDTNFELFFSKLSDIHYEGDFIIQGARMENTETPEVTCKKYLEFVKQYIHKYL